MPIKKVEKKATAKKAVKKVVSTEEVEKKPTAKKAVKKVVSTEEVEKKPVKKVAPKKSATEKLVDSIIYGMQEKKGERIVTMNLNNLKHSVADYFIICHCESKTQANAIANSVEEQVYKKTGESASHKEGRENSEWILLDYFNVVVHIFLLEQREFYGLERLWGDAEIKQIKEGK